MDFRLVEDKWQKYWSEHPEISRAGSVDDKKEKKYILVEFPYPSGSGLHVGHAFSFTGADVYARFYRMMGYNVIFPMGWDAFGLPTENYAIKMKRKPQEITHENTDHFREQMKRLAYSFDWDREVNTTDPNYYKWTQWIFIQLFKKGLAYKKEMPINWCPSCKIGLANEEVIDGKCERCGVEVSRRNISQWVVKITDYADKLIDGLKGTEFIEKVKQQQINWIGKSEGAKVRFKIDGLDNYLEVFTTRPDTLFGATFMVIAPEHELAMEMAKENKEVEEYIKNTRKKSDMERTELNKEKTGVFSGLYAINPVNDKQIPIWISDFVLASYGTGAIMSVPAHDERDFAFAKKFGLEINYVIKPKIGKYLVIEKSLTPENFEKLNKYGDINIEGTSKGWGKLVRVTVDSKKELEFLDFLSKNLLTESEDGGSWYADSTGTTNMVVLNNKIFDLNNNGQFEKFVEYGKSVGIPENQLNLRLGYNAEVDDGKMINSPLINGMVPKEAFKKMVKWLEEKGIGERTASYHLRDWIFSRQHYWGEPIPMVHCSKCANNSTNLLVVHGTWGSGEGNWFPWLKQILKNDFIDVLNPTLPDAKVPVYEERMEFLEKEYGDKLNQNSIIVGHSSGTITAIHLAEKYKIKKLILVSPMFYVDEDYKKKLSEGFNKETAEALSCLINREVDWDRVLKNVDDFKIIFGENDPYIPVSEFRKYAEDKFGMGNVITIKGYGHFSEATNDPKSFNELIPIIKKGIESRGWVPVPDKDLPIVLPEVEAYEPTDDGKSPLSKIESFVKCKCPVCGGEAERETDTMPNWAGSDWYFLGYILADKINNDLKLGDTDNDIFSDSQKELKYWSPVDVYIGGDEHNVLHLLYSRFIYKFLWDLRLLPKEVPEPYYKRMSHGVILGPDNQRMSKSKGNVIIPETVADKYGVDVVRMYLMFMGPFDSTMAWNENTLMGVKRFLDRFTNFISSQKALESDSSKEVKLIINKLIDAVTRDLEGFKYNTAIAKMMEGINSLSDVRCQMSDEDIKTLIKLMAPFAPYTTEELWFSFTKASDGYNSIHQSNWPEVYEKYLVEDEVNIPVAINGKVRDQLIVNSEELNNKEGILKKAKDLNQIKKWVGNGKIVKEIYVPNKMVNLVL
jgi:leucyl-tRNA synthetase/predicted alpha/beta hydrolase family esterase